MAAQRKADPFGFLRALGRWSRRGVLAIALANLAWDLWSWQDRSFAEGDRR